MIPNFNQSKWLLVVIGITKLLKAALLLFFALEVHHLSDPHMRETLQRAFHHIRVDPGNERIHALIARLTGISPHTLRQIRLGSFIYAALFATEGTGLVLRKKWAEYFTAVTTSLLLPLEVYEIFHGHHHFAKIILAFLNLAIVIYLVQRLIAKRGQDQA